MTGSPEGARNIDEPGEGLGGASDWSDHVNHTRDRAATRRNVPARPPRVVQEVRAGSRLGALLAFGETLDAEIEALAAKNDPEALNPLPQEGENI